MPKNHYYLLTLLPAPGPLGSEPPLAMGDLLDRLDDDPRAAELVATIALGDDLLLREAVLGGEIPADKAQPTVLTRGQLVEEQPLPPELAAPNSDSVRRAAADAIWEAYFRHAARVAQRLDSELLAAWVGYEVALRNELVAARARALGLEAGEYLVASDLADPHAEVSSALSQWSSSANPLEAQRALDRARYDWLTQTQPFFTFQDDELAAYAAKLQLLLRWQRIGRAEQETPPSAPTQEA